jgi:hypothetical protein
MTQEQIIYNVLEREAVKRHWTGGWVISWELQKVETPWGWLGTSADRAARRMAERDTKLRRDSEHFKGGIERRKNGKFAEFRLYRED